MKKIIFLLLLSIFFIAACSTQTTEKTATACPPDCSGGSAGVVSTINSPSNEGNVYGGDRLLVSVGLVDAGESSVSNAEVCETGLDANVFGSLGSCNCQSYYITLDDTHDANFQSTQIEFPTAFVSKSATGEQHATVYNRYAYTTYGPFSACITTDPFTDTSCTSTGNILTSSSSAPVQIDSVTEELSAVGSNSVTMRLRVKASLSARANERLIAVADTTSNTCVLAQDPSITSVSLPLSVILFGKAQDCGMLKFENGKYTAEASCKIENIGTNLLIGNQKQYDGWIRLDYGFEHIDSVGFKIVQQ
ncbi:hypothetical protein HZA98_01700 [Candidatus Woesearchaeota archaeon]|nr:hypothetical protein [Candidatus Woesearchaeota archaeon]